MGRCKLLLLLSLSLLFFGTDATKQSFAIEPQDQTVLEYSRVILPCKVSNREGILQWTKDDFGLGTNRTLEGFDRYTMIGSDKDGNYYLQIFPVLLEDDGKYQCQVSPARVGDWELRSRFATVTVLIPPEPPIITEGSVVMTYEYREVALECISYGGKPAADIHWIDDHGNVLTDGENDVVEVLPDGKRFLSKSILKLIPRKEYRNRFFTCRAQNAAEQIPQTAKVKLDVQYPPHVTVSILSGATPKGLIPEGGVVHFGCHVDANPYNNIIYTWIINGVASKGYNFSNVITLRNFTREDQNSVVKCRVSNEHGQGEDSEILDITYGPVFINKPRSIQADVGETVTLRCDVAGNPLPDISWTHEDLPQIVDVDSVLTRRVDPITAAEATIFMKGPPFIRSPPIQFGVEGDTVRVECSASSVPPPTHVMWIFNDSEVQDEKFTILLDPLPDGISSTLIIRESEERHFGLYKCNVTNSYGYDVFQISLERKKVFPIMMFVNIGVVAILIIAAFVVVIVFFWCCHRKAPLEVDLNEVEAQFKLSDPSLNIPNSETISVPENPASDDYVSMTKLKTTAIIEVPPSPQSIGVRKTRFPHDYAVIAPKECTTSNGYVSMNNLKHDYCTIEPDYLIPRSSPFELGSRQSINFLDPINESGLSTFRASNQPDVPSVVAMDPRFNTTPDSDDLINLDSVLSIPKMPILPDRPIPPAPPTPPASPAYVKVGFGNRRGLTTIYE